MKHQKTAMFLLSAIMMLFLLPPLSLAAVASEEPLAATEISEPTEPTEMSETAELTETDEVTPVSSVTVETVNAMIAALPEASALDEMCDEELNDVYERTQDAYDAYEALSDEERALVVGAEVFEELFAWFNQQVSALAKCTSTTHTLGLTGICSRCDKTFQAELSGTYYLQFTNAYNAASRGNTLTLYGNISLGTFTISKSLTFKLKNASAKLLGTLLTVNATTTFKNGKIMVPVVANEEISLSGIKLMYDLTVCSTVNSKSANTIRTVEVKSGTFTQSGSSCETTNLNISGGTANIKKGDVTTANATAGTISVSDGVVKKLNLNGGKATISGGTITTLNVLATTGTELTGGSFGVITCADGLNPFSFLPDGYAYKDEQGVWVARDESLTTLSNVTVEVCTHRYNGSIFCVACGHECTHESVTDELCDACGKHMAKVPTANVDGVYEIWNAEQLAWFAALVGGTLEGTDKNASADAVLMDEIYIDKDLPTGTVWTPIGCTDSPYTGTFDGNGKTVSGLYCTGENGNGIGLFGVVDGGKVKNFRVYGTITLSETVQKVGGAVGYAKSSAVVSGVTSYVTVSDTRADAEARIGHVGGIVGNLESNSTVTSCTAYGSITLQHAESVGGIVGNASTNNTITDCDNYADIVSNGNSAHVGGVAGSAASGTKLVRCRNYGGVTSNGCDCIGGVVAYANENCKLESCANLGTVTCTASGHAFIGGILGYINNARFAGISDCFNYGSIMTVDTYTNYAGAILGWNRTTNNIYNAGNVFTNNYYLDTSCSSAYGTGGGFVSAAAKDASAFSSGEVAWLLNGKKAEGVWKQIVETDATPVFVGPTVYYDESTYTNDNEILSVTVTESGTNVSVFLLREGSYALVLADRDGARLNTVKTETASSSANNAIVTVTSDLVLGANDTVFLWSALNEMKPLCEPVAVN